VHDDTGERSTLLGLFPVDPARHRKVFTPLSGLEYAFGTAIVASLFSRRQFAAVEEVVGYDLSHEDARKAAGLLRECGGVSLDPNVYRVQMASGHQALWSQRLSRNGILMKDDGDGWTTIPLGKGEYI
jgi:hypothetical protein